MSKKVKMPDFQFSFSPIYKKFVRELRDEESKFTILTFYRWRYFTRSCL